MTDARCEPPLELRGKDGWHWLVLMVNGEPSCPFAQRWYPDRAGSDSEWGSSYLSPSAAYLHGYRYLSPVLTPAEVEALRQKYQDDMHAAIVRVGQWSQRSGQLEGERDAVAIAFRKLGAVLRVNMLRWVPEASHTMIDGAIDACLGPVARRVLNDDHIADPGKMVTSPVVKDCLTTQAAYRAGAEAMREAAAEVADAFPARTHGALATAPYAAAEQAAEEVAAAIRALPLPAGGPGWRDMTDKPTHPMPVLYWFGKRWWHQADGTPATLDPVRDPAERTEAGWWNGEEWCETGTGHDLFEPWREKRDMPTKWQPLPAAPEEGEG